jgi:hypothetical protein
MCMDFIRVVDPDPHGFALFWEAGLGSAIEWIWICIEIKIQEL